MEVELIPQVELAPVTRLRVGDYLNSAISNADCRSFRFAVAFMRLSGWDRLSVSVEGLLNRGGNVRGAVGVDQCVTSIEALEALSQVAPDSTIFHTVSDFIYHPKLYLINNDSSGLAVVGSANLTKDGLFRNVEVATAVRLDFSSSTDTSVFKRYEELVEGFLDITNPNVKQITPRVVKSLMREGLVDFESGGRASSLARKVRRPSNRGKPGDVDHLFPPMQVPTAPPAKASRLHGKLLVKRIVTPPPLTRAGMVFLMQLSAFDSSKRTGVPGTAEMLIPHAVVGFFPKLSKSARKYPDAEFDVALNTPSGRERHHYRLWYYEQRATGTRIDEYRLRVDKATLDLSSPGGGDLLVISRLPRGSDPEYEATILSQGDPTFPAFAALCTQQVQGKKWGVA